MRGSAVVIRGDARNLPLPDASVDLICTSPPYFGLRSYTDGGKHFESQIGSEATPAEFLAALWECTREWVRVLKPEGSLFVNLGDKYAGSDGTKGGTGASTLGGGRSNGRPRDFGAETFDGGGRRAPGRPKSLLGLPWRYAIGCVDQLGLILRAEIIWSKPNGLPESVTDRVRRSHEQLFHFTRQPRYFSAVDEIREPPNGNAHARRKDGRPSPAERAVVALGDRNGYATGGQHPLGKLPGSVWTIPSAPLSVPAALGADHFAAFPPGLVRPVVLGWSPPGVCTVCGQGRRPVTDKRIVGGHLAPNARDYRRAANTASGGAHWEVIEGRTSATITGYACACPDTTAPTRPGLVLDPFNGTGTVPLVSSVYGRIGIGVDLSADYCRLARWRTRDPGERARALGVPKPPPVPDAQGSLFDDLDGVAG